MRAVNFPGQTAGDIASYLSRKGNYILTPMDIQPLFKNSSDMTLDYFENKYLYFFSLQNVRKIVLYGVKLLYHFIISDFELMLFLDAL